MVLGSEVHLEEFEANDGKDGQVKLLVIDEFAEELANLFEVEHGNSGSLCLACSVAPGEELGEVAFDRRLSEEVVYDLELCLRNLQVRTHGKLLQK